ncbi:MAG: acyl-CoA dehydrogenase [Flavobacteriaceae bacterium]|nr:acyl-CoA dehydrogenase [Flavobacteriaceae bacterium]
MVESKKITKGGEFIIREANCELIFTPEDFSEEQKMMRDSVIEFNEREVIPKRSRFEAKDFKLTEEVMKKAGEMGFLGVSVPEEYGGLGMDFVSTMIVCEYMSSGSGSISTAFGAHTGIGTMPILFYGTEEQKRKYLPKLSSGEWFGAYCLTEPNAGSDANSGKTTAELTPDKKYYKINGQKMWISNAGFAKLFIVFARIENDKNITAFIVEKEENNGMVLGEEEKKLGIRASSTRQVFFNDTTIPVENMLGKRGEGFKIAVNSLNVGRIKLGAACIDSERRATTISVQYANTRKQFNTRISDFGAIKYKIAEMATNTYVNESACYRAAKDIEERINSLVANNHSKLEAELKALEEFAIECSIIKVATSEDMQICSDEGIQIFGGMGFSEETPMEGAWRDARITRIYEGTNEINRLLSVGMLLKKAMKKNIDLITPTKGVFKELIGIPSFSFKSKDNSKLFSEEKLLLKNLKKLFLMINGFAVEKFGKDLDKHQQTIMALADILIEIYMAESALLRTEKNAVRFGEKEFKIQMDMSKLYLYNAIDIASKVSKQIIVSISRGKKQKMLLKGLNKFTKYENYPNVIEIRNNIAEKVKNENKYCF